MAKSKAGGTRTYLRGRVGSDVYSIGKDGKGKKQQVVRSLAESVANPQTTAQMRGRMIMSTVMQAQSALVMLIDHSFDNVSKGQPSISEFIRRNYALVKADVAAHPASGNSFGLNKYGEKGAKGGAYVIAAGTEVLPAGVANYYSSGSWIPTILLSAGATVADLAEKIGITGKGYVTYVAIDDKGRAQFFRVSVKASADSATVLSDSNIASVLDIDDATNLGISPVFESNSVKFTQDTAPDILTRGTIISVLDGANWKHNDAVMIPNSEDWTADDALPTYPTGTEKFLNGGEI